MKDGNALYHLLAQHTGSETIYRHPLVRSFNYTEGVRAFAMNAGGGGYWLLDILATEPAILGLVRKDGIGFATLLVTGRSAKLTVAADSDVPPVFSRDIDYTDCPEGEWKFFLCATEVGDKPVVMILLPSEY